MYRLLERTYQEDVTFFEPCPGSEQPSDPEDLTQLFKVRGVPRSAWMHA